MDFEKFGMFSLEIHAWALNLLRLFVLSHTIDVGDNHGCDGLRCMLVVRYWRPKHQRLSQHFDIDRY